MPAPGHFNARRTVLGPLIDQVRRCLSHHYGLIDPANPDRLIDSAPLPVCTYQRARADRTCIGA